MFARLVDVSRKTLSDIENDRGSYNTEILNKVFKPFGLKVGLLPSSSDALKSLLMDGEAGYNTQCQRYCFRLNCYNKLAFLNNSGIHGRGFSSF